MKLTALFEYLDVPEQSFKFYGDPKVKGKTKTNTDSSFLVGGKKDRNRFLKKIQRKDK